MTINDTMTRNNNEDTTTTTTTGSDNVYETHRMNLRCLVLGAAGAGKTSILRRYFYQTFDTGTRNPTRGSDFYVGKLMETLEVVPEEEEGDDDDDQDEDHGVQNNDMVENKSKREEKEEQQEEREKGAATNITTTNSRVEEFDVQLNLQLWDTPGRERFHYHRGHRKHQTNKLSDQFLGAADAVMLVYDMTSSTSFTQLLRWYADLQETASPDMPILIVGNKLDRAIAPQDNTNETTTEGGQNNNNSNNNNSHRRSSRVVQRDVLGLADRGFRGQDFQYEYRVSPIGRSKGTTTTTAPKSRQNQRAEVSSYLANRENWTADNSYLDSLINSEDESHPDRDMVLLWCMRNELTHLEVSAATGQGVNDAVTTLARMAMSRKLEAEYEQQRQQQLQKQLRNDDEGEDVIMTQDNEAPEQSTSIPQDDETTTMIINPSPAQERHPFKLHSFLQECFRPKNNNNHNTENSSTSTKSPCCFFGIPPPTHWFQGQQHQRQRQQQKLLVINEMDSLS